MKPSNRSLSKKKKSKDKIDKNYKSKVPKKSKKKVNKEENSLTQYYFTHDNGGSPFMVAINNNHVKVFKRDRWDDDGPEDYSELVKEFTCERVFVGKSYLNGMTKYGGGYGRYYDGNSVLLQLGKGICVFIGHEIYKFSLEKNDVIESYSSPVGNNDVPYPCALGRHNVYYFMGEREFVSRQEFPSVIMNHYTNEKIILSSIAEKDLWLLIGLYYYGDDNVDSLNKKAKNMKGVVEFR